MAAKTRTSKRTPRSKRTKRMLKEFESAISELEDALKTLRKVRARVCVACDPCALAKKR